MEKKRINKYLSEVGFCSRRKADDYISDGRVYINGQPALLGSKVNIEDENIVHYISQYIHLLAMLSFLQA